METLKFIAEITFAIVVGCYLGQRELNKCKDEKNRNSREE